MVSHINLPAPHVSIIFLCYGVVKFQPEPERNQKTAPADSRTLHARTGSLGIGTLIARLNGGTPHIHGGHAGFLGLFSLISHGEKGCLKSVLVLECSVPCVGGAGTGRSRGSHQRSRTPTGSPGTFVTDAEHRLVAQVHQSLVSVVVRRLLGVSLQPTRRTGVGVRHLVLVQFVQQVRCTPSALPDAHGLLRQAALELVANVVAVLPRLNNQTNQVGGVGQLRVRRQYMGR